MPGWTLTSSSPPSDVFKPDHLHRYLILAKTLNHGNFLEGYLLDKKSLIRICFFRVELVTDCAHLFCSDRRLEKNVRRLETQHKLRPMLPDRVAQHLT